MCARCRGAWKHFVPKTEENPDGEVTCACTAAAHQQVLAPAA